MIVGWQNQAEKDCGQDDPKHKQTAEDQDEERRIRH
jgi:hypothetical protein